MHNGINEMSIYTQVCAMDQVLWYNKCASTQKQYCQYWFVVLFDKLVSACFNCYKLLILNLNNSVALF